MAAVAANPARCGSSDSHNKVWRGKILLNMKGIISNNNNNEDE